ncbi:MAG: UDP-N-acetylmuramoyl-L-alanyl-D-glutamate--2,6-diaminopimelate ligase [Armatimonadota bacterium]|nr:UDP-N-acetylmuramoyl-L-alanyl-D-glutamate--2,6-diaminopimelate ligase [Armatimonadota bacterium]MDR7534356.1 UDP-N-acetylmuramoyl-L-alanyl-D-glutamate--2,6-diaminopimelate ligase [Armatimonadota bacterium]MDR7536008.1 UDP-N-acetylmuramoyl-L-alanyl-D-glutamate--2,6-diaminopimelate ligase [Armatimonadota bacterium]
MQVRALLTELDAPSVVGDADREVVGLAYHSREVRPGFLFAAIRGQQHDGHAFIDEALAHGAVAVLVERPVPPRPGVTWIRVADSRRALAAAAAAFFGHPSRRLRVVGVTGTNGKGATTHLVEAVLRRAGWRCGIIGTMGIVVDGVAAPADRTTPEAPDLQAALRQMADRGCGYAAVEVASHALALERIAGTRVEIAVFTNLTRDHLDFHGSMEAYRAAKARLFAMVEPSGWTVLNADDPTSAVLRRVSRAPVLTYGLRAPADVRGRDVTLDLRGSTFVAETPRGVVRVRLRLVGAFNVANALAALAVGLTQGVPLEAMADALGALPGIPGRFEAVQEGQPFAVIVDYAHTPDGLENVLRAARAITAGRLIVVFGCGGDRDRTKRPIMGRIAAEWGDVVVVTSDNPRSEEPVAIIEEIRPGVERAAREHAVEILIEPDRRRAIQMALQAARPGDLVMVAGKGHETYQEIRGTKYPFDDRQVVREALRAGGAPAGRPVAP